MMVNAGVLLLLLTVFTAPDFIAALRFDPASFPARPWTVLTYMFVHRGILHLALNTLMLLVFGPPIERRLRGRAFILFYIYCGIGAALFALGLSQVMKVPPFVGASGAIFGVATGFVLSWPDAEMRVVPLPMPLTARSLLAILIGIDLFVAALGLQDGIAHFAHVGGALAGYLFFRIQRLSVRRTTARPTSVVRRPVVTPMRVPDSAIELRPSAPRPEGHREFTDDDVDRVLDKISQHGIDSLTSQERKFLADVAERKRKETS